MTDISVTGSQRPVSHIEQLLNNEYMSDIVFIIGKDGQKIFGHRVFLEVASDVFYAMFNNEFQESKERSVKIPDIEPDVFLELLRFVYCNRAVVTKENLVPLYAGKYDHYIAITITMIFIRYLFNPYSC